MRIVKGAVALVAACAVVPAGASCWSQKEVAAAQVRDMQTMLMVAALRCHADGRDITGAYNGFVRANQAALDTMNDRMKARFRADSGPVEGQARYDRFTTQLANAYGSGTTDEGSCADAAALAQRASVDGQSAEALAAIAHDAVFATPLPDAACPLPAPLIVADAQPAATPAEPVVLASASVPAN